MSFGEVDSVDDELEEEAEGGGLDEELEGGWEEELEILFAFTISDGVASRSESAFA